MPHPSPRMLRQLPRLLSTILCALACGTLFANPLSAAPTRPAAVQARIDQQLAIQRAAHGDLGALRREFLRARAAQSPLARTPGRSLAERPARGPGVQGGGPPSALYIPFDDTRAVSEGYLTKIGPGGTPASGWPAFGLPVIAGGQIAAEHRSVDDAVSGQIVGWLEYNFGGGRLHAQRISQTGTREWGATGVQVMPGYDVGTEWTMLPDFASGAFFAWVEDAGVQSIIRVQHVDGLGSTTVWPAAGVALGTAGTWPASPQLARDGVGGVYVTWTDAFTGTVYAQHLDNTATPQLAPAEGLPFTFIKAQYSISPDASTGLTFAWADSRAGDLGIYAERIDNNGLPTWADSGVVVCDTVLNQFDPLIQPDGVGGLMVGWIDDREDSLVAYAQRIDTDGTLLAGWPTSGARVGRADNNTFGWIPDGLGGAFFALSVFDSDTGLWNLSIQHILSDGGIGNGYAADGNPAGNTDGWHPITMTLDGGGGVMASWFGEDMLGVVLFGQRFDIGGAPVWGGGSALKLLPSQVGRQGLPTLIEGGSGGARVGFEQYNGPVATLDAGFKRINQNGVPQGATIPVAYGPEVADAIKLIADGPNRAIALWTDFTTVTNLRAQRYSNLGTLLWTPGGVQINANPLLYGIGSATIPSASDGASGVIAGWSETDVIMQRIDSTGARRWGVSGTPAFTGQYGSLVYVEGAVQPAEGNGVFVSGMVFDNLSRWCVQKLDGDGNRLWGTNGVEFANDSLGVANIDGGGIVPDGQGGVYVAWQLGLFPDEPIHSIRVLRITAAGAVAPGWPALGVEVRGGFDSGILTGVAPDGLGNVVATWMEFRAGRIASYAQLVNAFGALMWNLPRPGDAASGTVGNEGQPLALDSGTQVYPLVATDGAGGAVFAWLDSRYASWDVFAQRITSSGALAWNSPGTDVCVAAGPQGNVVLTSDGANGALIAWADGRTIPLDQVVVTRVNAIGQQPWTVNGVVSTLASLQSAQVVDGIARLAWTTSDPQFRARLERRTLNSPWQTLGDVRVDGTGWIRTEDATIERGVRYGYRLVTTSAGLEQPLDEVWLDVPNALSFALHGLRPNPANGPLTVSFALPKAAPARLEVMDVAGRRVWSREVGSLGAGSHVLNLGEPSGMGPGLYFLRLTQGHDQREVRFTRVR